MSLQLVRACRHRTLNVNMQRASSFHEQPSSHVSIPPNQNCTWPKVTPAPNVKLTLVERTCCIIILSVKGKAVQGQAMVTLLLG